MDITMILQIINGVGFPIFVAVYLLVTTNKLLEKNTTAIEALTISIIELNNKKEIGGLKK